MWGGRFAGGPAAVMREINASIAIDKRLWREDIAASRAHAAMLASQGIISAEDAIAIGLSGPALCALIKDPKASTYWIDRAGQPASRMDQQF